jgi:hypothetical protein
MTTPQPPAPLTEMKLTDEIKAALADPFGSGNFAIISYVDGSGQPNLSFRGSIHAHGDGQLALWARNPEGGLLKALLSNGGTGKVGIIYRNPQPDARAMLTFKGTARVDNSDATRERVYNEMPTQEQNSDKEKKGSAVIIDLDSVDGMYPGARVAMRK